MARRDAKSFLSDLDSRLRAVERKLTRPRGGGSVAPHTILGKHIGESSSGRVYFGVGDNGLGGNYMVISPASETNVDWLMALNNEGNTRLRLDKDGTLRAYNKILQNGNLVIDESMNARHITENVNLRTYLSTNPGGTAGGSGSTYLALAPASDTSIAAAFWFNTEGHGNVLTGYKDGRVRVFGRLDVDDWGLNDLSFRTLPGSGQSGFSPASAGMNYQIRAGWVHIRGQLSGGSLPATGGDIWSGVPTNIRPSNNVQGSIWTNGGVPGNCFVRSNGTIAAIHSGSSNRSTIHVTINYPVP